MISRVQAPSSLASSVSAREATITRLQKGPTSRASERQVRDVFVASHGAELSALKRAVDLGGDKFDLLRLVRKDIDDPGIRRSIIDHFHAAASPTGQCKVYSDVDDTFYAKYKDDRFPKNTIYPGVTAFYRALDAGPAGTDARGDLLFLTARPALLENRTLKMLRGKGLGDAAVLEGRWGDLLKLSERKRNAAIAETKLDSFMAHRNLYPEYGSVFIGDSGQGDALAGAEMVKQAGAGMKAVYIHNVTHMDAAQRAQMAQQGIVVFDSYLDAALDAHARGLISRAGLNSVASAARSELDAMTGLTAAQRSAADAALSAAEARLAALP